MFKRFSLLMFPVACAAVLIVLAACGGSGGGGGTPTTPTLEETTNAVTAAETPAQGQFAYHQVSRYLDFADDPLYLDLSSTTRNDLAATYGTLIARDNVGNLDLTYGEVIAAIATEIEADVPVGTALAQLNEDLASASTHTASWARNELLLIASVDGVGATADKQINPAAAIALSRWFVARFSPVVTPLTRGPCEDTCRSNFNAAFAAADATYSAAIAPLLAAFQAGQIDGNQYTQAANPLRAARSAARQKAHEDFSDCIDDCHQQG